MAGSETRERLAADVYDIPRRRAFVELGDDDLARLAALRPLAEANIDRLVEDFYALLLGHEDTRQFFPDARVIERVKRLQRAYFLGLFDGKVDEAYVDDRLRVGAAHERIGLAPKWYLGAYRRQLRLLLDLLFAGISDPAEAHAAFASLQKLVFFDITLAIDAYIVARDAALERHQAALRELSTPVIRVHHGVLLLPLIGTVDSLRAEQVMDTVLVRIVEEQARVLILDIAGVPVVDTRVAEHLLQTTQAVRLLGCEAILTGISAHVARTLVQLGVEIASMPTRARLAEGIELALALVGKRIAPVGAGVEPRGPDGAGRA
ncbi:MAG: STAS domain-containing protein [Polyangiaceae bacterium]|nr:STAS domain-containing protein [Polyangiaceae bacterium]